MTRRMFERSRRGSFHDRSCESTATHGAAIYDNALAASGARRLEGTGARHKPDMVVAMYEANRYEISVQAMNIPRLSINLRSAPVRGGIASDRVSEFTGRRYSMFFTPAGADAYWAKMRPNRHINLYFSESLLDELSNGQGAFLDRDRPLLNAHLPRIRPLVDAIEFTILNPEPLPDEVTMGLGHLIVAELARATTRAPPTLAPISVARVHEYVAAHLSDKIRVADLALVAALSPTQFALRFHATLGCTPHQFILRRCVESAIRLLQQTKKALAEIAMDCGFCSQQHMTTDVKHRTGKAALQIRASRAD